MKILIPVLIALIGFLSLQYFDNFVTKAEYNEDKAIWSVIQSDIANLKTGQKEIKKSISELAR